MNYCANATGGITFKNVTEEQIDKMIDEKIKEIGSWSISAETRTDKDSKVNLDLWYDGNYHEEDVIALLDFLAPFSESGEFNFIGEDSSMWRFYFDGEKFIEEGGNVVFEMEQEQNKRFQKALSAFIEHENRTVSCNNLYLFMRSIGLNDDDLKKLQADYLIPTLYL